MTDTTTIPAVKLSPPGARVWRIGTLTYALHGLALVFFWMLLGDFCFTMMEEVVNKLIPITLKDLGGSDRAITLLTGAVPGWLNMIMTPVLGYRSDRLRTRWGRRIPYLVWASPFIMIFLILIGSGEQVGGFVHDKLAAGGNPAGPSVATVTFWCVACFTVVFQFFNMVVASVYYWLFNDVVPEHLLGRFYALFRVVGNLAALIYNFFVFGMAETHRREIYIIAGVIYCLVFLLMCWQVKEGQYPPPEVPKSAGLLPALKSFARECFSIRFYWWFYAAYALVVIALALPNTFRVFFARDQLGMSLDEIGKVNGVGFAVGMILAFPFGWMADKIQPIRLYLLAVVTIVAAATISFFGIHGPRSFWICTVASYVGTTIFAAANAPLFPQILPKTKFGQFAGATSLITALTLSFMNLLGGVMLDRSGHDYRLIYLWNAVFATLGLFATIALYRAWLRRGGTAGFVAPGE
jgi:MFS family permease